MKQKLLFAGLLLLPLLGWADDPATPTNPSENDFFGEGTSTVSDAKPTTDDQTKQFNEDAKTARIDGTLQADATWEPGWVGGWPGGSGTWNDALGYDLLATTYLDSRPDKNFRVHASFQFGYPFTTSYNNLMVASAPQAFGTSTPGTSSTTDLTINNIKVWELFSDVTIDDWLYLRFGKQSASWGVSYFYSVADVISLTAINVTNPTLQREGPVALKAQIPFPNAKANLTGFVLARDSYFDGGNPTATNLGYALQGDILVGPAQLTLGGFYQKDSADKLVATANTGLSSLNLPIDGTLDVFTEAILSRGSDVQQGSGTGGQIGSYEYYNSLSAWPDNLYYTGTAGFNYANSEFNFSLRGEYLYNPFGFDGKTGVAQMYATYLATQANLLTSPPFSPSNIQYTGKHNVTALFDMTNLGNTKLEFSTLVQANLSDGSGWIKPYFTIYPWTAYQLGISLGLQSVWGDDDTQYPLLFQAYNTNGTSKGTQRLTPYIELFFGSTSF